MANHPPTPEEKRARHDATASPKWRRFATIAGLILIAIIAMVVAFVYKEPIATVVAIVSAIITMWSIYYLAEQSEVANRQADTAAKQLELDDKRLHSEQFANAMELISKENKDGKPAIAARIGGINIMADLATKLPTEFAERVVKNLIAYIKDNAQKTAMPELKEDETPDKPRKLGGDVKVAFSVLSDILGNKEIGIDEKILDFSHQNFSYLDISITQVSLRHYNYWIETNFQGSDLYLAFFNKNAILREANFTKAYMRGVVFHGRVNLRSAIMTEADLSGASMRRADLSGADLRGAILQEEANLQGAILSGAKMHGAKMQRAKLNKVGGDDSTDLSYAHLHGANLFNAELQGAIMQNAFLWGTNFNAILRDVDLSDAKFVGADMGAADIYKNELTENVKHAMNGNIIHSRFGDILEVETCPDDFNWRLDKYPDSYALNGVLDNFSRSGGSISGGLALRKQARKLRDSEKISPKWREWLEKVNPDTGEHPEDTKL